MLSDVESFITTPVFNFVHFGNQSFTDHVDTADFRTVCFVYECKYCTLYYSGVCGLHGSFNGVRSIKKSVVTSARTDEQSISTINLKNFTLLKNSFHKKKQWIKLSHTFSAESIQVATVPVTQ